MAIRRPSPRQTEWDGNPGGGPTSTQPYFRPDPRESESIGRALPVGPTVGPSRGKTHITPPERPDPRESESTGRAMPLGPTSGFTKPTPPVLPMAPPSKVVVTRPPPDPNGGVRPSATPVNTRLRKRVTPVNTRLRRRF